MKFKSPEKPKPDKPVFGSTHKSLLILLTVVVLLVGAFSAGILIERHGLVGRVRSQVSPVAHQSVDEVEKNLNDELRLYEANKLPTLAIDLKFKYYRQMLEKRDEALRIGILQTTDADYVPATVTLNNGQKMDAEIRLKGDWTDHLEGEKWSFRIHLKEDDAQVLGFRQFSIQTPETRNFLYEWAMHQNLAEEDVLTTRYDFVNVMLNGELLGIYAIEENFTGELIESQGRRQGVIIRFDEENLWDKWAYFFSRGTKFVGNAWSATTEKTADITTFQSGKIAADPSLTAQAETARSLLRSFEAGTLPAAQVFDVKLMGRFFAVSDLWAACHGTNWHNLRFYFNPVTARLEPVVFDAIPFTECRQDNSTRNFIFDAGNSIFDDEDVKRAYAQELYRMTRPGYIEALAEKYNNQGDLYTNALRREYDQKGLEMNWQRLLERQRFLSTWFTPPNPIKGAYSLSGIYPGDEQPVVLTIELTNLAPVPVDVVGFKISGERLELGSISPASLATYRNNREIPDYSRYTFTFTEKPEWADPEKMPEIEVIILLAGIPEPIKVQLSGVMTPEEVNFGPLPLPMTTLDLVEKYPFMSLSPAGNQILVSPGVWNIQGDLVVPAGVTLQISAGTVLFFDPGAVLITRGALNLLGTADEPVLLTARDNEQGWGGVVVLESPTESMWRFASIENTQGIARDGWILTGGITFFKSDIKLDHAVIGNNRTEDAINVIHGKFTFSQTLFENTFADAFDSDFSSGEVSDSVFNDIAGDAIDVSGTTAEIYRVNMNRIGDKGLSIGEHSIVKASEIQMDSVGIGVASKDLSSIQITDSVINNARFAGLAAYIKKPVFGPATITAERVTITGTASLCVVQKGSSITLEGKKYPGQDLDVDKLYAEGILGN